MMNLGRLSALLVAIPVGLFGFLHLSPCASAEYPVRPVRMIVPYAAGGPTDTIARIIAEQLSEQTGQRFFVENRPGASGDLGAGYVANSVADGYTGLFVTNDIAARPVLASAVPYDPVKSFAPVIMVAASAELIVINPSIGPHSLAELTDLLRANPGKFSFATPGAGTTTHLAAERLFHSVLHLDVVPVPFNGGGPAITATIAGHTQIAVTAVAAAVPHILDGTIRALAVAGLSRSSALPDVRTLREEGINGAESEIFVGLVLPAGTSEEVVSYLHDQIMRILVKPDVRARLTKLGFDVAAQSPEDFASRIRADMAKWAGFGPSR
jgi:tripartite-type tricarboxylate transporter receptor subunit TctC